MFRRTTYNEAQATLDALVRSLAIIEFNMDGTILRANTNFLSVIGYDLAEIQTKHHRMFVDDDVALSADYEMLWENLRSGQFVCWRISAEIALGSKSLVGSDL